MTSVAPRGRTPRPHPGRITPLPPQYAKNKPPTKKATNKPKACPNSQCTDSQLEQHDGQLVCVSCGMVASEVNIVSELQFGEAANGAAVLQGSYVGNHETHARTNIGIASRNLGLSQDSKERSVAKGRNAIHQIAAALKITRPHVLTAALNYYRLCGENAKNGEECKNFVQGRRVRNVAACCLYVACRREKDCRWMLIEFSDLLHENVFKLGQTYTRMIQETPVEGVDPVIPENLVGRFVKQLQFGELENKVANDAIRLVSRMGRDWMTQGRRPAGICGAAIILAARMNNFRRSVTEVVYVVKVTELTINKRLGEFKVTPSSNLTVDQFRTIDLETFHDPPSFYQTRDKKSHERKRSSRLDGEDENDANDSTASSRELSAALPESDAGPSTSTLRNRVDSDGFAIPNPPSHADPPIDPQLLAASNTALSDLSSASSSTDEPPAKRARGRPRKDGSVRPPVPGLSPDEIADEQRLHTEITEIMQSPQVTSIVHPPARSEAVAAYTSSNINMTSTSEHTAAFNRSLELANQLLATHQAPSSIPATPEIGEHEFADDPEVQNCLLTEEEADIKERIWVTENADYLLAQQAKLLRKELDEKRGTGRVIKRRKRTKKGRIGEDGEGTSGARTPQEAVKMMLKKRGFSTRINYDMIDKLLGTKQGVERGSGESESGDGESSVSGSTRGEGSVAGDGPARTTTGAGGIAGGSVADGSVAGDSVADLETLVEGSIGDPDEGYDDLGAYDDSVAYDDEDEQFPFND